MQEVYITGANGFIGKHLTARLSEYKAVPHKDIQSTDFSNADKVFFLSSYGNMASHKDDAAVLRANISDLIHVINSVDWDKIQSFVFISTSSVKLRVQTMYSRTKKAGEEILLAYMEKYHAPITIIRPFSVTGVGEQKEHLIPTLIRSTIENKPINLSPDPKHDFIDVEDVVDGILNLAENRAKGIFELGNGESYSNKEVLRLVEKAVGKEAWVSLVHGLRPYDTACLKMWWMFSDQRITSWVLISGRIWHPTPPQSL